MSNTAAAGEDMPETRWTTLLVDDAAVLRSLIRVVLERTGNFEVVGEADNGKEGIALARALRPELVLLDWFMPEMDGAAALPQIRAALPATSKIVVFSGFSDLDAEALQADGAAGYILKGTTIGDMTEQLLTILED